jgi:glycine oxidase
MLDPSIRGGLFVEGDGSVDPRLLTRALHAAAQAAGVRLIPHPVTEILHDRRVTGVRLGDGSEVGADFVVLAAGWSSGHVKGVPPEFLPPVRPVKGQILRLRATQGSGSLVQRSVRGIVRGSSIYLVPRESGELVIGATQEELGTDTTVTAGGLWELLRDARMLVPGVTELEFAEVVAGLRPGTPDNAPVLGPSGLPGLVLATGHFRAGVLLTPVTADAISEYLETERLPEVAAPFTIARFAQRTRDASTGGAALGDSPDHPVQVIGADPLLALDSPDGDRA